MIYFDNAATTFPKPESVYVAMDNINRTLAVNAGRGSYKAAREATALIDDTKDSILKLFNAANGYSVAFTPSVTHAMNQILWGIDWNYGDVVFISPYEHNAVERTLDHIKNKIGIKVEILPVNSDGAVDVEQCKFLFTKLAPTAIITTAISNVTGYILPYGDLFRDAKGKNKDCITILDASQAAGLLNINSQEKNVDVIAFAGHKTLYGPFGVAGFVISDKVLLDITLTGGTGSNSLSLEMPSQTPNRYEASSMNIVAVSGLNAALSEIDVFVHYQRLKELTDYFLEELSNVEKAKPLGIIENQNIGIVSFVIDGYLSEDVGTILDDEYDIAVRTGYHCAPRVHSILKDKEYRGTIRVGFGLFNTKEEVDKLISALKTL